jgi:hypothetical protein
MSIIISQSVTSSAPFGATTTAQDVVNAVSQDARSQLAASGADANIILDYINRVQKRILRDSRHPFLLSAPKRFVTQNGVVKYWLGSTGSATAGCYDTQLNLTDVGIIKEDEVWDRTQHRKLTFTAQQPLYTSFEYPDAQNRQGNPTQWNHNPLVSPYVLNIFPAPNNQNTYQSIAPAPLLTTAVSGALSARTYYVRITLIDSAGNESAAGPEGIIYVPANSVLKVNPPDIDPSLLASGIEITNFKVYVGTTTNSETLQSTSTSSAWTEPDSGLVAGAAYPTTSSIEYLRGNVIEFRYYKQRQTVTTLLDVLQIPDDYFDIVVAGVNAYVMLFLKRPSDAAIWQTQFNDGLRQLTRDKNLFPKGGQAFIAPDPITQS